MYQVFQVQTIQYILHIDVHCTSFRCIHNTLFITFQLFCTCIQKYLLHLMITLHTYVLTEPNVIWDCFVIISLHFYPRKELESRCNWNPRDFRFRVRPFFKTISKLIPKLSLKYLRNNDVLAKLVNPVKTNSLIVNDLTLVCIQKPAIHILE